MDYLLAGSSSQDSQTMLTINRPVEGSLNQDPVETVIDRAEPFIHKKAETKVERSLKEIAEKFKNWGDVDFGANYVALVQQVLGIKRAFPDKMEVSENLLQGCLNRSLTQLLDFLDGCTDVDTNTCDMLEELIEAGAKLGRKVSERDVRLIRTVFHYPIRLKTKLLLINTVFEEDPLLQLKMLADLHASVDLEQKPQVVERMNFLFQNHGRLDVTHSMVGNSEYDLFHRIRRICAHYRSQDGLRFLFDNGVFCSDEAKKTLHGWLFREVNQPKSNSASIIDLMIVNGIRYPLVDELGWLWGSTDDQFKRLVDAGAVDLHAISRKGNTLLHFAVQRDLQDLAIRLLSNGLSPEAENEHGETPRSWAAEKSTMAEFLDLCMLYRVQNLQQVVAEAIEHEEDERVIQDLEDLWVSLRELRCQVDGFQARNGVILPGSEGKLGVWIREMPLETFQGLTSSETNTGRDIIFAIYKPIFTQGHSFHAYGLCRDKNYRGLPYCSKLATALAHRYREYFEILCYESLFNLPYDSVHWEKLFSEEFPRLREVEIKCSVFEIVDEMFIQLVKSAPQLEALSLSSDGLRVGDKGVVYLAKNRPQLKSLCLSFEKHFRSDSRALTEDSLEAIAKHCPGIKKLKISGCAKFSKDGFIKKYPYLKGIQVGFGEDVAKVREALGLVQVD